jgi:hypothetical protein
MTWPIISGRSLAQGDALAALLFDGVGGYRAGTAEEGDGSLLAKEIRKARAVAAGTYTRPHLSST